MNPISLFMSGLATTSLDVDNALYMTSMAQAVDPKDQNRLINWGLLVEFLGRLGLIALALFVFSGKEKLFTLFGVAFTPASVAMLAAGVFLFISSSRELGEFLGGGEEKTTVKHMSFGRALTEMSIVNLVLSIDTVVAVVGMTGNFTYMVIILAVSTLVRWLFLRQIAAFMQRNPSMKIITSNFLILIGMTLVLQGFHINFPEEAFGLGIVAAFIVQMVFQRRRHEKHEKTAQPV